MLIYAHCWPESMWGGRGSRLGRSMNGNDLVMLADDLFARDSDGFEPGCLPTMGIFERRF